MFKHYFEQLDNFQIYPLISLTIFFAFFVGLIWWVVRADKNYIKTMEQMPFSETEVEPNKTEGHE